MTRPSRLLGVSLAATAGWPLALWLGTRASALDVAALDAVLAAYAALLLVALFAADPAALRRLLAFRAGPALAGALTGALLVVAAHLVYPPLARALPFVEAGVRAAYGGLSGPAALLPLALIGLAEEVLFRGALVDGLSARLSPGVALVVAVVLYALAQAGAGLLLLPLLALGFGFLFALERRLAGSLWAPLATHLVWTPSVAVLFPIAP